MSAEPRKVLFIDNFDSFTYNLVDDFCKRDCLAKIYRADVSLEHLRRIADEFEPDLLVISPGPGNPDMAGVTLPAIEYFHGKLAIFGVCLGHQAIVRYFGGRVGRAPTPVHGKPSKVFHCGKHIFEGVENPLQAGRYHSLMAYDLPPCLETAAELEGLVMAVRHRSLPVFGVQFHPESILTPAGGRIIENVLSIAAHEKAGRR